MTFTCIFYYVCCAIVHWLNLKLTGTINSVCGHRHPYASCKGYRHPKPAWVIDDVIRLKALMPKAGCRTIATTFNRLHLTRRKMSVSKSFVAYTLRQQKYAILCKRREMRRRKPFNHKANTLWAIDLTGKQTAQGEPCNILGIIDSGTRRLLTLKALHRANAWTLLGHLFIAIGRYGKPEALRSDNARVFTGWLFTTVLSRLGIKQQTSDLHCPWQNGRIERLFGTLKQQLKQWSVLNQQQLSRALAVFSFWYNHVRPHQSLAGQTPIEAWSGINPYTQTAKSILFFSGWDGLLIGYWLRR